MRISPVALGLGALGALLAAMTSLSGLLSPGAYARETPDWAAQAVGQDLANLPVIVGLLWSSVLVLRGSAPALLVWLGFVIYLIYAFAIYAFALHFNSLFLLYVAVLGLSFYALVGALAGLDVARVTGPLLQSAHRAGASVLLIAVGAMFALLWLAEILPNLTAHTVPESLRATALPTNPVHVLDLSFMLPAMMIVGIMLRRKHRFGLLFAVPLLVFAVTMGIGILCLFSVAAGRGMPVAVPAAVVVTVIVALSAIYTWLLLRTFGHARA